ncbi:hypothetical protein [Sulfitobacter litoralis]|uniref:hypothetical protein n=1 Tax=Sulfitobacter litoralis TaxID=335975 RepID=UPI0023523CA7|nr:hypothetical protein [Sulfitobacter litoralis]
METYILFGTILLTICESVQVFELCKIMLIFAIETAYLETTRSAAARACCKTWGIAQAL